MIQDKEKKFVLGREEFAEIIMEMAQNSQTPSVITPKNIFQEANLQNQELFFTIINSILEKQSQIIGFQYLQELYQKANEGHSCLILMEHYSNGDFPAFCYLLSQQSEMGKKLLSDLIAMAGVKLNEEHWMVRIFTEAFTRLVIYPSRTILAYENKPDLKEVFEKENKRRQAINMASMRKMHQLKSQGKVFLVFPAGTRYRPGDPETKRGIKEIDSYIRFFDYCVFVSINGIVLPISDDGQMSSEKVINDNIIYTSSPVFHCTSFRNYVKQLHPHDSDDELRSHVAESIMRELERLHKQSEPIYERYKT